MKPVSTMVSPSPEQMARQEQQALSDIRGPRNASFRISLEYLASQVSTEAFGIILHDVESPEPKERELAAKLLKYYLRDDAALAALLKLEADKDPKVARKASLSLEDDTAATQADRASRIKALRERSY
ncbi:MAG: hypothetical protein EOP05_19740 [Proteobacteria bacterium]|nr:MAG: hypothetical protein EOP05_19740 [Pseudomonadota bacterium]